MMKDRLTAILFATLAVTVPAKAESFLPGTGALTSQTSIYDWNGLYIGIGGGSGFLIDEISVPAFGKFEKQTI